MCASLPTFCSRWQPAPWGHYQSQRRQQTCRGVCAQSVLVAASVGLIAARCLAALQFNNGPVCSLGGNDVYVCRLSLWQFKGVRTAHVHKVTSSVHLLAVDVNVEGLCVCDFERAQSARVRSCVYAHTHQTRRRRCSPSCHTPPSEPPCMSACFP